jgi:hypothetical protein
MRGGGEWSNCQARASSEGGYAIVDNESTKSFDNKRIGNSFLQREWWVTVFRDGEGRVEREISILPVLEFEDRSIFKSVCHWPFPLLQKQT